MTPTRTRAKTGTKIALLVIAIVISGARFLLRDQQRDQARRNQVNEAQALETAELNRNVEARMRALLGSADLDPTCVLVAVSGSSRDVREAIVGAASMGSLPPDAALVVSGIRQRCSRSAQGGASIPAVPGG